MARFATEDLVGRIGARDLSDNLVFTIENLGSAVFQVDDGFMSPLLTIKQSDHVYATDRYVKIGTPNTDFWPINGAITLNGVIYQLGEARMVPSPAPAKLAKSADNGLTWSVSDITGYYAPLDYFLVTFGGILYGVVQNDVGSLVLVSSSDLGTSWIPSGTPYPGHPGQPLIMTASGTLLTRYVNSIFYSIDQGASWTEVVWDAVLLGNIGGLFCSIDRWIVGSNDGTYRIHYSDDLGVSWNEVASPPQSQLFWLGNFNSTVVALFYPPASCALSNDNGATFSAGPSLPVGTDVGTNSSNFLIAPDGYAFYVTSIQGLDNSRNVHCVRSSAPINQPFTWTYSSLVSAPLSETRIIEEFHAIVSPATGVLVATGHSPYGYSIWPNGYAVWSLDNGVTWFNNGVVSKLSAHEGLLDLGAKYIEFSAENNSRYLTLSMDDETNTVFDAVGDIKFQVPQTSLTVMRGTQTHFHDRVTWLSPIGVTFAIDYGIHFGTTVFVFGNDSSPAGGYSYSTDSGATWSTFRAISPYSVVGAAVAGNMMYVALSGPTGRLFATSSDGWTWTVLPEDPVGKNAYTWTMFLYDQSTATLLSVDASAALLLVSSDNAETWSSKPHPLPVGQILGSVSSGTLVIANSTDMVWSVDLGDTWSAPVDIASHIISPASVPILFHIAKNPGTNNLHFLFACDGDVHEIYDVQYTADATTFVKVEKFPNGVSIQYSRRLNCSEDGSTVLIPCNGPEANSSGRIVNLTTKAVYEALSEVTGSDLRATIWTGSSWVCAGHAYWPRDVNERRGLALTSSDGITWGDLRPAVTLLPEGGVLDLYVEKLSICSRRDGPDTKLLDLKFAPNSLILAGGTSDRTATFSVGVGGELILESRGIAGDKVTVRGPNGDLNFTSDDSNQYHGIELVQTNAAGGVGIWMQHAGGSNFNLGADSNEAQLVLYGDNSGNTLFITSNAGGYARYYSNQSHEITSGSWYPLRITTQGDAQSYGYFEFQFDNNPYLYIAGGPASGSKGINVHLQGYQSDVNEPSVVVYLSMTGWGWVSAASIFQSFQIKNTSPTDGVPVGQWVLGSTDTYSDLTLLAHESRRIRLGTWESSTGLHIETASVNRRGFSAPARSRTNLVAYSDGFTQWTTAVSGGASPPSATDDQVAPPYQPWLTTAGEIVFPEVQAGQASSIFGPFNLTDLTTAYTASVWLRTDGTPFDIYLYVIISSGTTVNAQQRITVSSTWERFSVIAGYGSTVDVRFHIGTDTLTPGTAMTATPGGTLYAWGAQFEEGLFPTDNIRTLGAAVTENESIVLEANCATPAAGLKGSAVIINNTANLDGDSERRLLSVRDNGVEQLYINGMGNISFPPNSDGGRGFLSSSALSLVSDVRYGSTDTYFSLNASGSMPSIDMGNASEELYIALDQGDNGGCKFTYYSYPTAANTAFTFCTTEFFNDPLSKFVSFRDAQNAEPAYISWKGDWVGVAPDALVGTQTQNSPLLVLRGKYWAADVTNSVDATIQHRVDDVDPLSAIVFSIGGDEVASLNQEGTFDAARFISHLGAPTYGVTVAIDAAAGCVHNITATDGVAFTISNPTNALTGQVIFIKVKNSSGGALGTVTWDTLYKMSAWTSPADGFSRAVEFYFDGTNWVQLTASGVDIPN
jgi:hypothetical protein